VIVKGKGDDVLCFLTKTGLSNDKKYSLSNCNSLCSVIVKGKGNDVVCFLAKTGLTKDK